VFSAVKKDTKDGDIGQVVKKKKTRKNKFKEQEIRKERKRY
jgi:hypothetical protein